MRQRRNERGVALVAVAVFLSVLLALTAVGIDIGRLAHTATEVQTVADATARAGAVALHSRGGTPGGSDPEAHVIAHDNIMNGEFAPDADIQTGDHQILVEEGNYDLETKTFTAGGAKRLAVRVTANTRVENLFAGIFDFMSAGRLTATQAAGAPNKHTTVEKLAIAAFAGPKNGCEPPEGCSANDFACYCEHNRAPCLPIATWSCLFPDPCPDTGCSLPTLKMSDSNTDTAAWTGYQSTADTNTMRGFMPDECRNGNSPVPEQTAYDSDINVSNGSHTPMYDDMKCVFENKLGCKDTNGDGIFDGTGGDIFTIPVFEMSSCGTNPTGTRDVVGFATVQIQNVIRQGNTKEVDLQSIVHSETSGTLGGGDFGSGGVLLVQ